MRLISLASSSQANCHVLYDGIEGIMLDCGMNFKGYNDILDEYNVKNILLTHGHSDHIEGLKNKNIFLSNIMVHGNDETVQKLSNLLPTNKTVIQANKPIKLGNFIGLAIQVPHDAKCFAYVLKNVLNGENTLYLTDCGKASQLTFKNITNFIIECNYSKEWYEDEESISKEELAKYQRLSGNYGHISVEEVCEFLDKNICDSTRNVVLTHISRSFDDYKQFEAIVKERINDSNIKVKAINNKIKHLEREVTNFE